MFGLGVGELLVVAVVLLLAVGPEKIPTFMREAGRLYGQVKRASDDLRRALVLEADRMDAEERYAKLRERQRQAEEAKKAAEEARKAAIEATGGAAQSPHLPPPAPNAAPAPDDLDDDPLKPARRVPPPAASPPPTARPDPLPEGVSPDEWDRLPPQVQAMLRSVKPPEPKP